MSDFDYDQLDPGIREAVRFLRGRGLHTTDSGDGRTKDPESCGFIPFPHVICTSQEFDMQTMLLDLEAVRIHFGDDSIEVEASYGVRGDEAGPWITTYYGDGLYGTPKKAG